MKLIFSLFFSLFLINSTIAQLIDTFPYFTGFEGVEGTLNENFPGGWTWEDLNTNPNGNSNWQIIKNSEFSVNARTDSTAVHMFSNFNETNNDWLFTPQVKMTPGGVYTLNFWYRSLPGFASIEKLKVHIGTANNADSMGETALWVQDSILQGPFEEASISFTAPVDMASDLYFGFHYFSDEFQNILIVDDVTITEDLTSSIPVLAEDQIEFGPNPAKDFTTLTIQNKTEDAILKVWDIKGGLIYGQKFNASESINLDLTNYLSGIYFIDITEINSKWAVKKKLVVE